MEQSLQHRLENLFRSRLSRAYCSETDQAYNQPGARSAGHSLDASQWAHSIFSANFNPRRSNRFPVRESVLTILSQSTRISW